MEGVRQMRYERGVPLTAEERAGGGQGAGRVPPAGWGGQSMGFNPYAAEEQGPNPMDWLQSLFSGGGGPPQMQGGADPQMALLQALVGQWQPIEEKMRAASFL